MKYKLIIDKNAEEEIIAVVHAPSSLTQQIENLVCSFSGADCIMGYRDDEMRKMAFSEIECITILDRKVIAIDTKARSVWRLRTCPQPWRQPPAETQGCAPHTEVP